MSVAELKQKPPRKSNGLITEDSAAQRFAEIYVERLRYCHDAGSWFEWDGAVWRQNRTRLGFQWARELARDLAAEEDDRVRYVTSKTSFASGVERFAQSDPVFAVTSEFWDRDPMLLGTPGGPIDLRTGRLIGANPGDGITKSTAVPIALQADCPLWHRFLDETTGGDGELKRFLWQFLGYCLTGDIREHALIFGYGSGGNGKSVFLNTASGIIGSYATIAAMDTFAASSGDRHSTDMAMLAGARLVSVSETEEGRAWAESRIKALTGGDRITARFMRQDNFTFAPTFKLFVVGNHKPVLRNVDDAARRRFNILPFVCKPQRPDPDLENKLKAEWPAILRWMVEGCLDWQASGLQRPQSVIDATAEYFGAQDIIGQFLDEECDYEPGNTFKTVAVGELFSSWTTYAKAAGEPSGSNKAFTETLSHRGIGKHRTTGGLRVYRGVRAKLATETTRYGNDR